MGKIHSILSIFRYIEKLNIEISIFKKIPVFIDILQQPILDGFEFVPIIQVLLENFDSDYQCDHKSITMTCMFLYAMFLCLYCIF